MRRKVNNACVVAGLFAITGCYSGFEAELEGADGGAATAGPDTGADSGANDSGDDGGGDPDDPATQCADADVGVTDLRRLTGSQYDHAVRDLFDLDGGYTAGFSPDERTGAFKSNSSASVDELQVEKYMEAAETIALDATADLATLLPCDIAEGDACAESYLTTLAPRAYRRPLEAGELDRIIEVYQSGKAEADGDIQNGLRIAISAILQSPFFLYHVEFGLPGDNDERIPLSGHELASRLSFFLWDSMPDDALFEAAGAGDLDTADGIRNEVERMLASPKAAETVALFHQQWLGMDELEMIEKSPELFPNFDTTLAESMKDDVSKFANYVLNEGDGSLDTLLSGAFTLSEDPRLLEIYGVELPAGHVSGTPIPLPADERAGLLTMPGVMAEHAHPDQTSPIYRGVLVRTHLFCQEIPPPPPDVDNVPPNPDPNATTRERFAQHTSDPSCAGCHVLIDPLGFGLENYDPIGAFRGMEGTLPIDNSGEVVASDVDAEFAGGVELAGLLSQSATVRECAGTQWFRYALGRIETDADECALEGIHEAFAESNYDVRVLLREVALSSAFRFRKGAA